MPSSDGQRLYLVPHLHETYSGVVTWFDAKSPSWLFPRWNASFY